MSKGKKCIEYGGCYRCEVRVEGEFWEGWEFEVFVKERFGFFCFE